MSRTEARELKELWVRVARLERLLGQSELEQGRPKVLGMDYGPEIHFRCTSPVGCSRAHHRHLGVG